MLIESVKFDSPEFRNAYKKALDVNVNQFTKIMGQLKTDAKEYSKASSITSQQMVQFSSRLQEIVDNNEVQQESAAALSSFHAACEFVAQARVTLQDQCMESIARTLDSLTDVDAPAALDSVKKYEENRKTHEDLLGKLLAVKDDAEEPVEDVNRRTAEVRLAHVEAERARLDLVTQLNGLHSKRMLDAVACAHSIVNSHVLFYKQSMEAMNDLETKLRHMLASLRVGRDQFDMLQAQIMTETSLAMRRAEREDKGIDQSDDEEEQAAAKLDASLTSAAPAAAENSKTNQLNGWLFKLQARGPLKEWKRRYFTLDKKRGVFYHSKSKSDPKPMNEYNILLCSIRSPSGNAQGRKFTFDITSPDVGTMSIQAENEIQKQQWMRHIQSTIATFLNSHGEPDAGTDFFDGDEATESAEPGSLRSTGTVSADDRKLTQQLYTQLRKEQENVICADCGCSEDVTWVSINHGVLLCIQCSGAHRNAGTHVSKVRSLTLDALSAEQREIVRVFGNRKANSIPFASVVQSKT